MPAPASGGAVVRKFAEQYGTRLRIGLLARGEDGLRAAAREVEHSGGRALVCVTDVSQFDQVESAAERVERELGPIEVWVNNAMVSMYSPFMQMTMDEFSHIVNVTLMGYVRGTHSRSKRMIPRDRGVIVQVGSALAFRSIPLQSAYCACKHAIEGFTESIRSELIHNKSAVRVSLVHLPGVNTTQFTWTKNNLPNKPRPTGPIYEPEVAAEAIVWIAENDRRQLMVGMPTVKATLGEKIVPGLLDEYLAHAAWEGAAALNRRIRMPRTTSGSPFPATTAPTDRSTQSPRVQPATLGKPAPRSAVIGHRRGSRGAGRRLAGEESSGTTTAGSPRHAAQPDRPNEPSSAHAPDKAPQE